VVGRQEQPIPEGPLHDFARDLRRLRLEAGQPSYRALSRKARYSPSALSAAAAGQMLPTLGVTRAYVKACGGDPYQWEQRWRLLAAQLRPTDPELLASSPLATTADPTPQPAPDTSADEPAAVVTGVPRPQEQDAAAASAAPTTSGRPRVIVRFGLGPLLIVTAIITALIITNAHSPNRISAGPPAGTPRSEAATPPQTGSVTPSPRRRTTPAPSTSPIPNRAAGPAYRLVYGNRTLTTKDYNVSIDLTTGRVGDTGRWLLGTNSGGDGKGAFELQDATDAVIIGQRQPTAAECATAATEHPLHALLHFAQTPAGTWFCLRWQLSGDIAVVQTLDMDTGEYGVNVTVNYYQHR